MFVGLSITPTQKKEIGTLSPANISGLTLWLDASDASTITKTGDDLTAWADKSGATADFVQGNTLLSPHHGTRTLNGKPVVDFDGSAQFMTCSSTLGTIVTATEQTLFIVASADSVQATAGDAIAYADPFIISENGGVWGVIARSEASQSVFTTYNWDGNADTQNRSITVGEPLIFTAGHNDGKISARVNGGSDIELNSGNTSLTPTLRLGDNYNSAKHFDGYVAEILCFNRHLSEAEQRQVRNYLGRKWGIVVTTPPKFAAGARLVFAGDSITETDTAGINYKAVATDFTNDVYTLPTGYNQGTSGLRTDQLFGGINTVLAEDPDVTVVLIGHNDYKNPIVDTAAETINFLNGVYANLFTIDSRIVAVTVLPHGESGYTASDEEQRLLINAWIRAQATQDLVVVDMDPVWDLSIHTNDNLHPNEAGATLLGEAVGVALLKFTETS